MGSGVEINCLSLCQMALLCHFEKSLKMRRRLKGFCVIFVHMKRSFLFSFILVFVLAARSERGAQIFFLPVGAENVSGITETDYQALLREFQVRYFSRVFHSTGKAFLIVDQWQSPYFAAFAELKDIASVSLWGGMARAPGATKIALAATLCHELGHLLAGEPRQTIPGAEWSSSEGQSDHFAAMECLPELFRSQSIVVEKFDPEVLILCEQHQNCAEVVQAGVDFVRLIQRYSYRENPRVHILTPAGASDSLVRNSYPSDQCRLDIYVNAGLCLAGKANCQAIPCWKGKP